MSAQQPASFLRLPEVLRRVGLSRATVYAQIKQGSFPYPVSLGPRSVAWIDNEIQSWIDGRISAARGGVQMITTATTTFDMAEAALVYAARGWLVLPLHSPTAHGCSCGQRDCKNPAKHPRTVHGLKDASEDADTIRRWWEQWPDANIGIVTGPQSGILVLDVDGKQGEESLIDLERHGHHLPDTYSVRTGGGGQHLYFLWPEGVDVRNSQGRIARGLDIRGEGGYVVAPSSLHASGERYEVNQSAIPPAPCPEWLPSVAQGTQSRPAAGAAASEPIGEVSRTNHLVSLAGTMNKRGMDPAAIEAALLTENTAKFSFSQKGPLPEEKVKAIARDIPARYLNPKSTPGETAPLRPHLVCLGDVEARAVDWLWEPFIPLRMLSMITAIRAREIVCGAIRGCRAFPWKIA